MKRLLVVCVVLLFLPCVAFAVDCPIPDTGQTKCYNDTEEITCPASGESFFGQDGNYTINPQSYTKLDVSGNDLPDEATEWVMVRDNVTGLIWENKTDDGGIHDKDTLYNWYDAQNVFIATLNSQNFGQRNDWRLPTVEELSYLLFRDSHNPSINLTFFVNTESSRYWSSTTVAPFPLFAWFVTFSVGSIQYLSKSDDYCHVRAVRREQCGLVGNYIDNSDGTVTDTATGLMWQKDLFPGRYNWRQALAYCENLTLSVHSDWRLPNANELLSLADYSRYNPSIDTSIFPNTAFDKYWSSTTSLLWLPYAQFIFFYYGDSSAYYKFYYHYVRAVRGGVCGSSGDSDGDTLCDDTDNCIDDYNPFQSDCDQDARGDVCDGDTIDSDGDSVDDGEGEGHGCDNCPVTPNGPSLGTCYLWSGMPNGTRCNNDRDCGWFPGSCSLNQEDTYPPQGNSIGDVCDCEANFFCDLDVGAEDLTEFYNHFGRSLFNDPCTNENQCKGDINCDGNVAADDVTKFLEDFGRSQFNNPCPACVVGAWCVY